MKRVSVGKIEYAAVVKITSASVRMRRLFEEGSEEIEVTIKDFLTHWELVTDKAELDKMSECARWRHQGASNNGDYMRFVLMSRAVQTLERARIHLDDLESKAVPTVDGAAMFRQPATAHLRIFVKPRITVQAARVLAPWSVHLLPLTTNVKVLKAAEPKPHNAAVQFSVSAASVDTSAASVDTSPTSAEFKVWLLPQTSWAKHGNAAETAFVEPFWLAKRLAANEQDDVEVNLVLERLNFTIMELAQRGWLANETIQPEPAAKPEIVVGARAKAPPAQPPAPPPAVADHSTARSATNTLISVPVLTNPKKIPQGTELVWRDASWTKVENKKRKAAVMVAPPSKSAKLSGKRAKKSG